MTTISIIVPVYKVESYIHCCVNSILNQTFTDFELILVDDGSPDNCPSICDYYANIDSRVKVIHKANGGLSDARNAGLRASIGKYISFVDSDDFIRTDMYEILLKELLHTGADFIKSNFVTYFDGNEICDEQKSYTVTRFTKCEAFDDFFYTEYSNKKPMKSTVCDALYKRKIFFEGAHLVIEFPEGKNNEDTYIFPQLILRSEQILHLDAGFYYYRTRKDSIVHSPVSLREIASTDLWREIDSIISQYSNKYTQICALNSVTRNLNILERIYFSKFKGEYFVKKRDELIKDYRFYKEYVKDRRIHRTLKLIRCYPFYLCARRIFRKYVY